MSDALTDIARDGQRAAAYNSYLDALKAYLKDPSEELLKTVVSMAAKTDAVSGGFWGSSTELKKNLRARIKRLQSGDRDEWAKLLHEERCGVTGVNDKFKELLALSPFAGSSLLCANYYYMRGTTGIGGDFFVRLMGEVKPPEDHLEGIVIIIPDEVLEKCQFIRTDAR
jgi:hypothetical protein